MRPNGKLTALLLTTASDRMKTRFSGRLSGGQQILLPHIGNGRSAVRRPPRSSFFAAAGDAMLMKSLLQPYLEDDSARKMIKNMAGLIGFDTTDWVRVVMYRECFAFIESIGPETLDVLEISGGPQWRRKFKFSSYTSTDFPDFDVCAEVLDRQFDLIIADQVFEHLPWPMRAGRNVYAMLRLGGYFVIATPFLVRLHEVPIDCSRWTEQGLSYLLQECGFQVPDITTGSWGNRRCLRANLVKWRRYGFYRSLANEPEFPVMVWAIARKQTETSEGR